MQNSIQSAFTAGEVSPSLYGRIDLQQYSKGCSTMRNFFVNYRGGASSRAGFAYVGMCKQGATWLPGNGSITTNPPRDIRFQFNINQGYALEFGDQYMRIKSAGAYVVEASKSIIGITKANPAVLNITGHGWSVGDWIYIAGAGGMTNFNGLTWVVKTVPDADHVTLTDLFGVTVNSTLFSTYTGSGTAARIYTVVSPYAAIDLPFLKFTQSADTMSLCCVNQQTLTEYPTYELTRAGATNWTFTATSFTTAPSAPTGVTAVASSSTTINTWYSYVVTAIDSVTGQESIASTQVNVQNNNIAIAAGSNTITWNPVTGASSYKVYKATPSYNVAVPVGTLFGYVGTANGTQFVDGNITADFTGVPPIHKDPFARGQIASVNITAGGSTYTQATVGYTITTSTGSGFVGTPVVVAGAISSFIIQSGGKNYAPGDTIAITGGTGATATLTIGALTGTYPGVVNYYQQRRVYGYTVNKPDTYFFSKPGNFYNMDSGIPTTDSDAFTGTPWAQQVNGIQAFVPVQTGLITLTGNGAWLLNGGTNSAITPSDQTATAQAYNGCHYYIPPIIVNYDILYVQSKGSIVRDLAFDFYVNVFRGADKTVLSNHLFNFHQLQQWAYAEEPYKVVWALRDDGVLLSFTFLKEQEIEGWARHDTNGFYVSVVSVTEPPIDAIYTITKRYIQGPGVWAYYSERMDNRNWQNVEDCFCVDAGLQYPMSFPNAILTPAAAEGTNGITSVKFIAGGSGYTAPVATVVDPLGTGSGATFNISLSGGVITAITPVLPGSNYTQGSTLVISDSTGFGCIAQPIITNNVIFNASSAVFDAGMVGNVIRIGNNNATLVGTSITATGGGKAIITAYNGPTQVVANIVEPITNVIYDDPHNLPAPAAPNQWSIAVPTKTVTGLNHLEGMTVAILADGSVVPNQTVVGGAITLPDPASAIVVGLPYTCQLQTLYLDVQTQGGTIQGKRKNVQAMTVRVEKTRGLQMGTNQPDQATQPDSATVPWTNMFEYKERNASIHAGSAIPLETEDQRIPVPGGWDKKGQLAIQQTYPLPANISAVIPEWTAGDNLG